MRVVVGQGCMTNSSETPDLAAIAREAEVEILTAGAVEWTTTDASLALGAAELGYYEAELGNLRDAATSLDAAERLHAGGLPRPAGQGSVAAPEQPAYDAGT